MSSKTPLTDSISRLDRDASHQSRIDAHREQRIKKTEEHREQINARIDRQEQRRTDALEKVHAARQDAYAKAGIANNPAVARSEERLMRHLDKSEQRRAHALQHVQDHRSKVERRLDDRVAKIEGRDNSHRERHTDERELRHFNREHKKEMDMADHVESSKEQQLRQAREQRQHGSQSLGTGEDDEMTEVDSATLPQANVGVFTVKTSSED